MQLSCHLELSITKCALPYQNFGFLITFKLFEKDAI